jgi:hypothetical protein
MDNDTRDNGRVARIAREQAAPHIELTLCIDGALDDTEYVEHAEEALEWIEGIKLLCPGRSGVETLGVPGHHDGDVPGLWEVFVTNHGAHAIGAECDCIQFETSHALIWSNA